MWSFLVLLLFNTVQTLPSVCQPGETSITIRITAEFSQQSVFRASSYGKFTDYSRQFASMYEAYNRRMSKSSTPYSIDGSPPFPSPDDSPPFPIADQYQPFTFYVAADIDLVASTTGSLTATHTPGSVIIEEIDSEFLRRTETSPINEYHPGFLQISQRLTHYVNIGGITATMEEESLFNTVPEGFPASSAELIDLGKNHILERYGDVGGQIRVNSFQQTKCFNPLTEEEIDRVTSLEDMVLDLSVTLYSNTATLAALQEQQSAQDIDIATLNEIQTETVAEFESTRSTLNNEISNLKSTRSTQNNEISNLKSTSSTLNTKISTLESTSSTQINEISTLETTTSTLNTKIGDMESTSSSQSTSITAVATRVTGLENRQTKIVKSPTGSLRPETCLVTCVGSTGRDSTSWTSNGNGVWLTVSMTECGFTGTPVITASVAGSSWYSSYMTQGVREATSTSFGVVMFGWVLTSAQSTVQSHSTRGATSSRAESQKWHVNWSATGYTC